MFGEYYVPYVIKIIFAATTTHRSLDIHEKYVLKVSFPETNKPLERKLG
jgi:hypothetical protein